MNTRDLVAIDVHVHAEVSCCQPPDPFGKEFDDAADKYFGAAMKLGRRPTIPETIEHYRALKIGFVMFTVDCEANLGRRRIPNEEIAEFAQKNDDIMIAFGSIDPHKGKMGLREARKLIEDYGVRGFKFHPTLQAFYANDRMAYPLYELISEYKLTALFHSGHSGIGSGMKGGGGLHLKYSEPIYLDDVAADFPEMNIIIAHPSWPWQEQALSIALHKPNVYIDLSGWSPKYFSPELIKYSNSLLKRKMLFGSDFPLIGPDRWIEDFNTMGFKPEVQPMILKQNAMTLFNLTAS